MDPQELEGIVKEAVRSVHRLSPQQRVARPVFNANQTNAQVAAGEAAYNREAAKAGYKPWNVDPRTGAVSANTPTAQQRQQIARAAKLGTDVASGRVADPGAAPAPTAVAKRQATANKIRQMASASSGNRVTNPEDVSISSTRLDPKTGLPVKGSKTQWRSLTATNPDNNRRSQLTSKYMASPEGIKAYHQLANKKWREYKAALAAGRGTPYRSDYSAAKAIQQEAYSETYDNYKSSLPVDESQNHEIATYTRRNADDTVDQFNGIMYKDPATRRNALAITSNARTGAPINPEDINVRQPIQHILAQSGLKPEASEPVPYSRRMLNSLPANMVQNSIMPQQAAPQMPSMFPTFGPSLGQSLSPLQSLSLLRPNTSPRTSIANLFNPQSPSSSNLLALLMMMQGGRGLAQQQ